MIMCYHKYRSGFSYIISIPRGYPGEINNNSSRIKPPDGASGGFLFHGVRSQLVYIPALFRS